MRIWRWLAQTRILSPYEGKRWIKLRERDGVYFIDLGEFAKSEAFKRQRRKVRKMLKGSEPPREGEE